MWQHSYYLIHQLASTCLQDQFDCLDLTDNEIGKLENFPLMRRLTTLLVANNRVSRIADGLGAALPALKHIVLTNNRISSLGEIEALGAIPTLQSLCLLGNPVTRKQNYRLYTIAKNPGLSVLDFQRVRRKERVAAAKLFASKAGKAFAQEVTNSRYAAPSASDLAALSGASAGSGMASSSSSSSAAAPTPLFDAQQLAAIQEAIASAATRQEIEAIEECLKKGEMPPAAAALLAAGTAAGEGAAEVAGADSGAAAASSAGDAPVGVAASGAAAAAGTSDDVPMEEGGVAAAASANGSTTEDAQAAVDPVHATAPAPATGGAAGEDGMDTS